MKISFKLNFIFLSIICCIPFLSGCSNNLSDVSLKEFTSYMSTYTTDVSDNITRFDVDLDYGENNISISYDKEDYFYINQPIFLFETPLLMYRSNDFYQLFIDNLPAIYVNYDRGEYLLEEYGKIFKLLLNQEALILADELITKYKNDDYNISIQEDNSYYYISVTNNDDNSKVYDAIMYKQYYLLKSYISNSYTINMTLFEPITKQDHLSNTIDSNDITREDMLKIIDSFYIDYSETIINIIDYQRTDNVNNIKYYLDIDLEDTYYHYQEIHQDYYIEELLVKNKKYNSYTFYQYNSDEKILHATNIDYEDAKIFLNDIFKYLYDFIYIGSDKNRDYLTNEYTNISTFVNDNIVSFQGGSSLNHPPLDINISLGSLLITYLAIYFNNENYTNPDEIIYVRYNQNAKINKIEELKIN